MVDGGMCAFAGDTGKTPLFLTLFARGPVSLRFILNDTHVYHGIRWLPLPCPFTPHLPRQGHPAPCSVNPPSQRNPCLILVLMGDCRLAVRATAPTVSPDRGHKSIQLSRILFFWLGGTVCWRPPRSSTSRATCWTPLASPAHCRW